MTGWTLAIDVGTSRTAGAAAEGDRVVPLEIEGNRWMSSTVAVADDDSIVVGRAALAVASARPDRAERSPKRNVGSPVPMVLGERAVSTAEAFAALMTAVADEAKRRFDGAQPSRLALTHPVRWEEARQEVLIDAAALAGLPEPVLVPEPVAAALHYAAGDLGPGDQIAVYDLGGGTFDTVVMRRTDDGFEVMGPPGGDESIGGDHFDHLVFLHLGSMLAAHDAELWQNMLVGTDRKWMRAAFDLLTEARNVKENLSLYPSTQIYVPAADRELLMTRAELEALIENPIERSIEELADTILDADLDEGDIKAIYLVGGSSRIPMVYDRLVARFGDKVRTRDEPKSVVVEGAARLAAGHLAGSGASRQALATDDASTPLPAGGELTGQPHICGVGENLVLWDDRSVWIVAEGHSTRLEPSHPVASAAPTRAGAITLTTDGMLSSYDGEVQRWSTAPPFEVAVGPVSAGDATLVADRAGQLASFDHRGSMSWMLPVGHSVSAIAASASVVVLSTLEGRAICIDAMTGRVRWIYPTRDRIEGPALLGGRLLHVTSADSILYSLDVDTGRPAWAYRLDAPSPAPVLAGDLVVVSGAADVVGLDRSSGAERWRLPIAGCVGLRGGSRAALATLHDQRIMWVDQHGSATDLGSHSDAVGFGDAIAVIDGQRVEFVTAPLAP